VIARQEITGLVLAGGRGRRMGGVDKGLQRLAGAPLVVHALERLRPQVGPLLVSANRNLERYAEFGLPVLTDPLPGHAGPLAGMLAGLSQCRTPYLVVVPCDAPALATDLVARLAWALNAAGAEIAIAATQAADGSLRMQPVFCLMQTALHASLAAFLAGGERKVQGWTASRRCTVVAFGDERAFDNINTAQDLDDLTAVPLRST
jgi:molybdopterin-guanine dinucleotide biosynthesis protein A